MSHEASEVTSGRRNCSYCGAELNPRYYFCTACAAPYKDEEGVLPPMRPVRPSDGMLIAGKAPAVWPMFWTYFAVAVAAAILSYALFEDERPDLAFSLGTVAIFVTTCIFAAIYWRSLAVQFKRLGLLKPATLLALLALVPLLTINYFYHRWLVEYMGVEHAIPLGRLRESGLSEVTLTFMFCVFPAVTEEIAFRGLIQHWLKVAIPPRRALILASALFTVLHFSVLSAPYIFAVGMLLGWVKWKTQSLYPPMLVHFAHNLVVLALFTF